MKIYTKTVICNSLPSSFEDYTVKLFSHFDNHILLKLKYNNKVAYQRTYLDSTFEKNVFFEIAHSSPLWTFEFEKYNPNSEPMPRFHSLAKLFIHISVDESLVEEYLDKSLALNNLLTSEFNNSAKFTKLDETKSYFPNSEIYEPTNINLKLYEYQKRSLSKMIQMEKNTIKFEVEYTTCMNFLNTVQINYDPIKNIKSNKKRIFQIKSNGGILADEMGLGKTITMLSLIVSNPNTNTSKLIYSKTDNYYKINSKATLIICPSHITKQWEDEAKKVNSNLKVLCILTKKDHEKLIFKDIIDADIIITSHQFLMNFKYYPCINYKYVTPSTFDHKHRNNTLKDYYLKNIINGSEIDDEIYSTIKHLDLPLFEFFYFHRLVLDEGHEIFGEMLQNISQARYMATWLSCINSNSYWYISGSPFVNYVGLINCVKYLNLILYDPELKFEITTETLNKFDIFNNILNKKYILNNVLEKLCIRHRKCDVNNEIKIFGYDESIVWIEFTDLEKKLYESKKNKISKEQLQQLCCHPLILDSCRKVFGDIEIDLSVMQVKLIEHHNKVIKDCTTKISKLDTTNQAYHMLKKTYENSITDSKYMLSILNKLEDDEVINDDDNNCSICLEVLTNKSITNCGHIFCSECIKNCLKYKQACPMCKKNLTIDDVYLVKKKGPINESLNGNPLIEKYGSKLGKIIIMIRNIVLEPDSRIIIFSQWDFMLSLIGKTLSENGVANCFVKGNVWSRNSAINKFRNGKTLSGEDNKVIMLSLQNSASGTNLTEATHIFFVEPINACREEVNAIEGQAIGRACRLGQKNKIQLFRVLLKDTIEEEIYNTIYKET
jgi:SNF2 family DNA or RNA helicase